MSVTEISLCHKKIHQVMKTLFFIIFFPKDSNSVVVSYCLFSASMSSPIKYAAAGCYSQE